MYDTEAERRAMAYLATTEGAILTFGSYLDAKMFRDEWNREAYSTFREIAKKFRRLPTAEEFWSYFQQHNDAFKRQAELVKQQVAEQVESWYEIPTTPITRAEIGEWVVRQKLASVPAESMSAKDLSEFVAETQRFLQRALPLLSGEQSTAVLPMSPEYREKEIGALVDWSQLDPIPTGFSRIDSEIQYGGLLRGETAIVMEATSGGKTSMLINLMKHFLMDGRRCLYVTLEGGASLITSRWYYNISGIGSREETTVSEFHDRIREWEERNPSFRPENMVLSPLPSNRVTSDGFHAHIQMEAARLGAPFDVVLLDFGDLLKPAHRYEKKYDHLGELFYELVNIAVAENVLIWTATQGNRGSVTAKMTGLQHIADGFNKTWSASFVMSMGQDETDQEMSPQRLWLSVLKNRRGRRNFQIPTFVDWTRYRIWEDTEGAIQTFHPAGRRKKDEPQDGITKKMPGEDGFKRRSTGEKFRYSMS